MKRVVFLFFAIASLPGIGGYCEGIDLVKISGDPYPPWMDGESGEPATSGIAVEIASEIFRRLGIPVDIRIYPYKRCISYMQTGERDLQMIVAKTPDREKFMLFTDPIIIDPFLIYYNGEINNDFEWSSWEDLKPYTIGITDGFDYGPDFTEAVTRYSLKTETVPEDIQNIKKVLSGRIDIAILIKSTAVSLIRGNPRFQSKIKSAKKPVRIIPFYFTVSRKSPLARYLDQINKVIKEMQLDGTMLQLIGDYAEVPG